MDFRMLSFSLREDSRTLIELEAMAEFDNPPQFLHSLQVNEYGQVSEGPGSPVQLDELKTAMFLLQAGPTNYVVGIGGMLSEWSVQPDGSLKKVGEIVDSTGNDSGSRLLSTSSGRVFMLPKGNYPGPTDVVTFLHDHPLQVMRTPFEYLISEGSVFLFRAR
jgi:hypothetical protein